MTTQYLVESKKALEIVERKVREFENGPDRAGRIAILKDLLPKTEGFEEFRAVQGEIDKLEYDEMRQIPQRPISKEVTERIKGNFEVEMTVVREETAKKYAEVEKLLAKFEKDVTPLLNELTELHDEAARVSRLGLLTDLEYRKDAAGRLSRPVFQVEWHTFIPKNYAHSMKYELSKIFKKFGGEK